VVIEGMGASGPYRQVLPLSNSVAQDSGALRHLWARHRIQSLSDQEGQEGGDAQRKAITDLGLQYGLLTQYTSFLAVDQVVRNTQAASTPAVDQPSPMPQGVSDFAVGAEVPGTPEPATWGAVIVLLSVLAMLARRARRRRANHYTA
jgi:Ca-activated chloride channel family protein